MWTLQAKDGMDRLAAAAVYLAAVTAFLLVQEIGLRLRREEHRAWWAGTGRDLINLGGLVAIAGALVLAGFSAPAALLVGGTLTLLMFGVSVLVATQTRTRHPRRWAFVAGLLLALPVIVFPADVLRAFARMAAALFGAQQ